MTEETPPPTELEATRSASPPPPPSGTPKTIGSYRVLGKLGEGGMGTVFEAEQQNPRRRVAIKIVRGGQFVDEQRVRMFQREAATLARLKHPNIGAIYESGRTADGQHFFAMELVHGMTLDAYLKGRPEPATPPEIRFRLGLLRRIADAVHYAHQRGVIHRDLKPANIVVTEEATREDSDSTISALRIPEVKILDFGLARITDGDVAATMTTEIGVIKGTLAYMSPEQARGNPAEIDVRADVYALGVILYEMLAGSRPYDVMKRSPAEALRVICEEPPLPLGKSWSGVRKSDTDIETIVGKALEKEPERRYASAAALSEDLGRYLTSQPLLARPPSTTYQLKKFAGRNRALVGGVATTFVALLLGVVVSVVFGLQARAQRNEARQEAETARRALEFMSGMFEVSDPSEARGNSITAREILDKGTKEIDESLADQPEIQSRLMDTMGSVYRQLGLYPESAALLEKAVAIRKRVLGNDHPDTCNSMNNLAVVYWSQGRFDEAEPLYLGALETRRRLLGNEHSETINSMGNLALLYWSQGRNDEAEPLHLQALEGLERVLGRDHPDTLKSMSNLCGQYWSLGRDEAEPLCLETLETQKRVLGGDHPDTLRSMANLAGLYGSLERNDEAEPLSVETLEIRRRVLGDDHPDTLLSMMNLAVEYGSRGRDDEAESWYLEALEAQRRVLGRDHPQTLTSMNNLGDLYSRQGRAAEAEPLILETLEASKRVFGDDHTRTLLSIRNLGNLYWSQGRFVESEPLYSEILETQRRLLGNDHPDTITSMGNLCDLLINVRKMDRALELCTEVTEARPQDPASFYNLAGAYALSARPDEALAMLRTDFELGDRDWEYLSNDPWFESMRADPRFVRLVEAMKAGQVTR